MDKIISLTKQRILQYIDYHNIVKESFFKKTLISASNFKGTGAKSELGSEMIGKILTTYLDLNADWVITGRGEMLIKKEVENTNDWQKKYYELLEKYNTCLEQTQLLKVNNVTIEKETLK